MALPIVRGVARRAFNERVFIFHQLFPLSNIGSSAWSVSQQCSSIHCSASSWGFELAEVTSGRFGHANSTRRRQACSESCASNEPFPIIRLPMPDVGFWHKANIIGVVIDVCFRG
jgi:hypothetical protein